MIDDKKYLKTGTLWCGIGNDAQNCTALGEKKDTDSCCRIHDMCPYKFNRHKREHNGYEWSWRRLYTLTHCECDLMFRNCLAKEPISINSAKIWHSFKKLGVKCYSFFPCSNQLFEKFWNNLMEREIGKCNDDIRVVVFDSVDDYSEFLLSNLNTDGLLEQKNILSSNLDRFYVEKTKKEKYLPCMDEINSYKKNIVDNFDKVVSVRVSAKSLNYIEKHDDLSKKLEEFYQNEIQGSKKKYLSSKTKDFFMKIFSILT